MKSLPFSHKGFTLMEVMVAVSIFTIITVLGISSLLAINRSNAQSRADREATDSLSSLTENLTRTMRTGVIDSAASSAPYAIEYTNQFGDIERYSFQSPGNPQVGGQLTYTIQKYQGSGSYAPLETYDLTPQQSVVMLQDVQFLISGAAPADNLQPYVQIIIRGQAREKQQYSPFWIQTGVSPRQIQSPFL